MRGINFDVKSFQKSHKHCLIPPPPPQLKTLLSQNSHHLNIFKPFSYFAYVTSLKNVQPGFSLVWRMGAESCSFLEILENIPSTKTRFPLNDPNIEGDGNFFSGKTLLGKLQLKKKLRKQSKAQNLLPLLSFEIS